MYVKAIEQLGSENATVRIGGVYSLERLGNQNSEYRENIVNVLCAYMRRPFMEPSDVAPGDGGAERRGNESALDAHVEREERDVRICIQRVLFGVLPRARGRNPEQRWGDLHLDLEYATFFDLNVDDVRISSIELDHAVFSGHNYFHDVVLDGFVPVSQVRVHGYVTFYDCIIDTLRFYKCDVRGGLEFDKTTFGDDCDFSMSTFSRLEIRRSTFKGEADFRYAKFKGSTVIASDFLAKADFTGAEIRDQDRNSLLRGSRTKLRDLEWPAGWREDTASDQAMLPLKRVEHDVVGESSL
jgi:hypothetical protein